ncbi:DUF817 family protein [Nocardiopsis dassonvillei]|uniref:DUF817 family protein n=1 Tax=Nocardiopsis TaxID=2013 RepID=UPI00200E9C2B|nr:DUF817 family protein [Nocardiopsis dassonvillei]MCK9869905.1 DUF817 family protein [Nocardiopsis dassonvillei]
MPPPPPPSTVPVPGPRPRPLFWVAQLLRFGWLQARACAFAVCMFAGFALSAVGSYIVRAWRLLDLEPVRYRAAATTAVAVAVYLDFLTHHWLPDLRVPLAVLLVTVSFVLAASWKRPGRAEPDRAVSDSR